MPHGVGLEISHHPLSMRRVADLIIALDRLRDHQRTMSPGFRDEDLLSMMLESVVEGKAIRMHQTIALKEPYQAFSCVSILNHEYFKEVLVGKTSSWLLVIEQSRLQ